MTKDKAIDLSSLDTAAACDKGFELELKHPITNEPVGAFISVVGKDSKTFEDFVRKQSNDRLRRNFQNQRRGKDAEAPTVEQIEADAISLLVACTTGFRNVTYKGSLLTFSEENARLLYTEQKWVRSQVDEAVGDIENFMSA
jgi:hypothetical protein